MKYLIAPFRTLTKKQVVWWMVGSVLITILDILANGLAVEDTAPEGMGAFRQFIGFLALLTCLLLALPIIVPKSYLWFRIIAPGVDYIVGHGSNLRDQWMETWFYYLGDLLVCFLYFVFFQIVFCLVRQTVKNCRDSEPNSKFR